jgi:hypothetical protein
MHDWRMTTNSIWVTLITASLGGFLTLIGTMITQHYARRRENAQWHRECEREQARWTHEDAVHTRQRLADSYLEVLRLVEREAQWLKATTENWKVGAVNHDYQLNLRRVELPERTIADRSTIAAHLGGLRPNERAHVPPNLAIHHHVDRGRHHSWDGDVEVNGEPPRFGNIEHVQTVLHPKELAARHALADAIAKDLGHR